MENNIYENDAKFIKLDEAELDDVSGGVDRDEAYCDSTVYCASCGVKVAHTMFLSQAKAKAERLNLLKVKCPSCSAVDWRCGTLF